MGLGRRNSIPAAAEYILLQQELRQEPVHLHIQIHHPDRSGVFPLQMVPREVHHLCDHRGRGRGDRVVRQTDVLA